MALFFIGYALVGAALYKPSRTGSELGKGAYFVAFPFHALAVPVLSAAGGGLADLLRSKGLAGAIFVGLGVLCLAGGADP